jgi:hypothetical protein
MYLHNTVTNAMVVRPDLSTSLTITHSMPGNSSRRPIALDKAADVKALRHSKSSVARHATLNCRQRLGQVLNGGGKIGGGKIGGGIITYTADGVQKVAVASGLRWPHGQSSRRPPGSSYWGWIALPRPNDAPLRIRRYHAAPAATVGSP